MTEEWVLQIDLQILVWNDNTGVRLLSISHSLQASHRLLRIQLISHYALHCD